MSSPGIVKIVHNAVTAKILDASRDAKLLASDALSYKVAGSEHMGGGGWDGYSSFFNMKTDTFPAGFVRRIVKVFQRQGWRVALHGQPAPEPLGPVNPKVDDLPSDPAYDYQWEAVELLVKLKGMIAQIATGGGKSRIFKLAYRHIGRKTLFITTRKSLMYQMAKQVTADLKEEVGILGDSQWSPKPGLNVSTVDTLASRLEPMDVDREIEKRIAALEKRCSAYIEAALKKLGLPPTGETLRLHPKEVQAQVAKVREKARKRFWDHHPVEAIADDVRSKAASHNSRRQDTIDFLATIEFVVAEEAHEVSSDSFYSVMCACKNAHYRLALTATPFMKDDEGANMRLMACTGPIAIQVTEKRLIDLGILATPYFRFMETPRPEGVARGSGWQRAYKLGIVQNKARNRAVVYEALKATEYGLPVMILIQQEAHGKGLLDELKLARAKVKFISGKDSQPVREQALAELGSGEIQILIGSTILDVGIDVPGVGLVIIAGGGKAEVGARQRIGRGLRRKKTGPNKAFIIDFTDNWNTHTAQHAAQRRMIVETTPGFAENVLPGNVEFDYAGHGFSKAP